MKSKIVWFVVFLVAFLVTSVAGQFFRNGDIDPIQIAAAATGIFFAFLMIAAPQNLLIRRIGVILVALSMPIVLVGLVSLFLPVLFVSYLEWIKIGVYIFGVIATLILIIRFRRKLLSQIEETPSMDERGLMHYAWASAWSFVFLNFLIIGALIQPWISLNQIALWVYILVAGLLFWLVTMIIMEMRK